jgi:glycosyltransferase involved in cell wall biosynthesis
VVNDGSTDASPRILDEWAARDARLRVIHQANTGLTRALIRGCSEARGEFIARQDCGDVSLPGRLARQLAAMQAHPGLSFVSCATRYATDGGEFLYEARGSGKAAAPLDVIDLAQPHGVLDGPAHHGSVMFRRSAYEKAGGYRPAFYYGQDWDLWYRLAEQGQFQMLPEVLYEARMGVTDISMNNKARQELIGKQSLQALRLRMAGLSDQPAVDAAALVRPGSPGSGRARGAWRGCYFMGECLRRNGNREAALRYLSRAVKENPVHLKSWVRLLQARFG